MVGGRVGKKWEIRKVRMRYCRRRMKRAMVRKMRRMRMMPFAMLLGRGGRVS